MICYNIANYINNDLLYNSMEQLIKSIHKKLEQLQDELDGVPFNQMGKIQNLERRIKNLDVVMETLRLENQFEERGSCVECGELGDGKIHNFIYCGYHGVQIEA